MVLTGLKSKHCQGCILSGDPKDNLFPCCLKLLEAAHIPYVIAPQDSDLSCGHMSFSDRDCPVSLFPL